MKQIKKRLLVLSVFAMMVMSMCVSAFAAGEDTSGASGTSATVISAFQTGFQGMASDAMSMIAIIVPIAVGVAGVIWLARKAMSWFKSMGQ
ncbi:MAG: hypothetical protein HFF42_02440 [Lawsonibacter sp.]|jgi:hypothetical protein|nr:hypothetical protein [Lawsonibacter sp.]